MLLRQAACLTVCALAFGSTFIACGDEEATNPAAVPPTGPTLGKLEQLVPFPRGTPNGLSEQPANNCLDAVVYRGRTFLAWRTAPTHFASPTAEIHVASEGSDGWRFEGTFALGTDLREPRFLVLNDRLILYFAVLGKDSQLFEPQGMKETEYQGVGKWTDPEWTYEPGFIPWRARVIDGKAYLIGYIGGDNIYDFNGKPIDIHFLTTKDGRNFDPVVAGKPIVQSGGGSETDFTFTGDGTLVAVTRNEAGDANFGFGSKICKASPNDLGNWQCAPDKKKYDSPLIFKHGLDVYLVGRRNMTETGNYDLDMTDLPLSDQEQKYEVDYSLKPKRCSLWKVDPDALSVSLVLDFPSRGDTCFASEIPSSTDPDQFTVYNYSNMLDGQPDCTKWPDQCDAISWFVGQGSPTMIYRIGLTFPKL
jgi:hypothetical protein